MVVWEQRNDVVAHQSLEGRKDVVRQSGTMSWNQTPQAAQYEDREPKGSRSFALRSGGRDIGGGYAGYATKGDADIF